MWTTCCESKEYSIGFLSCVNINFWLSDKISFSFGLCLIKKKHDISEADCASAWELYLFSGATLNKLSVSMVPNNQK